MINRKITRKAVEIANIVKFMYYHPPRTWAHLKPFYNTNADQPVPEFCNRASWEHPCEVSSDLDPYKLTCTLRCALLSSSWSHDLIWPNQVKTHLDICEYSICVQIYDYNICVKLTPMIVGATKPTILWTVRTLPFELY